jgi:hypothetical protein
MQIDGMRVGKYSEMDSIERIELVSICLFLCLLFGNPFSFKLLNILRG